MISLLVALALSQTAAVSSCVKCIVAVPESVKDPAKATDAKESYKLVTICDPKDAKALAVQLAYDIVSCAAPTANPTAKASIDITVEEPPCECQDAAVHKCKVNALDPKDGKPVKVNAASNLTYQSGELIECAVPPVKKVCVQLFGKESMPDACWPGKATKGDKLPAIEVAK